MKSARLAPDGNLSHNHPRGEKKPMRIFILGLASRFGLAPLLLCGAVGLGLGMTQAAHGAGLWTGMTPMQSAVSSTVSIPTLTLLPGTTWQDIYDCLDRDGELNINESSGLTTCTPAPPAPVVVAPAPEPSQPVATPRSNVQLDYTRPELNFIRDEPPDYTRSGLCRQLGGAVRVTVGAEVCKDIDADGTFCIVGSKDAFPCQGLYKSVLICNQYGRTANNPFICGAKCPDDKFACGSGCVEGGIAPPDKILPVARGYSGEVFRITATAVADPGGGQFEITGGRVFSASVVAELDAERAMLIRPDANLREGVAYSDVVNAKFSCAGLESHYGSAQLAFTVTIIARQRPQIFRFGAEVAGEGVHYLRGPGILSVGGDFGSLTFGKADGPDGIFVSEGGTLSADASWSVGDTVTITAFAVSPEFKGRLSLTASARFMDPFSPYLTTSDCQLPANYNDIRGNPDCFRGKCPDLDFPVYNAALTGDVDRLCGALRAGGTPNADNAQYEGRASIYPPTRFALGVAAQNNDITVGRILLANGARLEHPQVDGALNYAAYGGHVLFGEHLIGRDSSSANRAAAATGNTPAHSLATRPRGLELGDPLKFAELLTMHGSTGNEENRNGENVLHVLTDRGHGEHRIVETFMRAGVSVNKIAPTMSGIGLSPLARAAVYNHGDVVRALMGAPADLRPDVDLTMGADRRHQPALAFAASRDMIDLLVSVGADVSLVATLNVVTLIRAAGYEDEERTKPIYEYEYGPYPYSIADYMILVRNERDLTRHLVLTWGAQCIAATRERPDLARICTGLSP